MSRNLFILLLAGLGVYYLLHSPEKAVVNIQGIPELQISYNSSLSIDKPPIQNAAGIAIQPIPAGEYTFIPLAEFQVAARVLGVKHYRFDREAGLAPVDLALGWGPMAKENVLRSISISQGGRFYYWSTDDFPIPRRDIETNSANMHFVPASPAIEEKLKKIKKNDLVKFKGYLIRIDAKDGWRWLSSMTREDTGDGACELVLVDDISLY